MVGLELSADLPGSPNWISSVVVSSFLQRSHDIHAQPHTFHSSMQPQQLSGFVVPGAEADAGAPFMLKLFMFADGLELSDF